MNFVSAKEVKPKQCFAALIYGPTGIGKTTTALSAPSPAIIDFDGGITRVDSSFTPHAMIAQVEAWEGWSAMAQAIASVPAETIIIDTVSKLLDMIQAYVLAQPKYAAKKLDKPTLQAFGDIKVEFVNFLRAVRISGKNQIYVAQEVETMQKNRKGEDIRYHQPACGSDKNRTEILQDLDLVGYMYKDGAETRITFDPTDSYYGKNTCGIPETVNIARAAGAQENILFQWLRDLFVKHQQDNLDRAPYYAQLTELLAKVDTITDAKSANAFCASMKGVAWLLDAKTKVLEAMQKKTAELGLTFDTKAKKYV